MTTAVEQRPGVGGIRRVLAWFGAPELVLLAFYLVCITGMIFGHRTPTDTLHLGLISGIGVLYAGALVWIRLKPPFRREHFNRALRRMLLIGAILGLYFQLRWVINSVHSGEHDWIFSDIDIAIFGAPVAVLIEPYQTHFWVEWFAFYYWLYFYLIALYIPAHALFERDGKRFAAFGAGIVLMHCVGWSFFLIAPGLGPYWYLKDVLGPLPGGIFTRMSASAYTWGPIHDIFPSIHSGIMFYLTLHALSNFRRHWLYKVVGIPWAFITGNIIIATVYLRWHYVIDVAVGLSLSGTCFWLGPKIAGRWARFRERAAEPDVWW